jgi:LacI family transcriptional regulator
MTVRVTMADVAREAGVSLMTVSRALNGKDDISEATRVRIQQVIERLGYRRSNIARGLVTKRTGTLGLVVPDNSNPFFSEVARGVEHAAYAEDYNVFLCNIEEDVNREKAVLQSLTEQSVDGLILCSSRLEEDELRPYLGYFPALVLVSRVLDNVSACSVRPDDEDGVRLAVEHLLQRGHRAIGLLAGPTRSFSGQLRAKSYRDTMEAASIAYNPSWTRHSLPMVEASQQAAVDLLTECPELSALFCFNDLVAVGALKACEQLGRAVPDDMAIVGFDNILLASLVTPALTTVNLPRYALGQKAAVMLLEQINGETSKTDSVLPVELVIRASAP